jgi:hypothetical protein
LYRYVLIADDGRSWHATPTNTRSGRDASDHVLEDLLTEGWIPVRETPAAASSRIGCVVWLVLMENRARTKS